MKKATDQQPARSTVSLAEAAINRRCLLRGVAVAASAIAAPRLVKNAFASSGELNFMGWTDYDFTAAFSAFTKATGIKVNFNGQADQDAMFAQCGLALQTGAVDVVEPTLDRYLAWVKGGLIQPWNTSKLTLSNYLDGVPGGKSGDVGEIDGGHYFVPSVWGSEALLFSSHDVQETYGTASLADLFDSKYENKIVVRAHSSLAAMGRLLDAQGKLPKPFLDSYKDEATMKQVWDVVLAEAVKHKANIAQWWVSENDVQEAFRTSGCVLGLCWDSTGANMVAQPDLGFVAPKEGAFGWSQGFVLMANAKNTEQGHEWVKWISTAEGSAAWASAFRANAVGKGGIDLADDTVKRFYKAAYPGDALQKLWWVPTQETWFIKLRNEYADKFKAA